MHEGLTEACPTCVSTWTIHTIIMRMPTYERAVFARQNEHPRALSADQLATAYGPCMGAVCTPVSTSPRNLFRTELTMTSQQQKTRQWGRSGRWSMTSLSPWSRRQHRSWLQACNRTGPGMQPRQSSRSVWHTVHSPVLVHAAYTESQRHSVRMRTVHICAACMSRRGACTNLHM